MHVVINFVGGSFALSQCFLALLLLLQALTNTTQLDITSALNDNRTSYHLPCAGEDRVLSAVNPGTVSPPHRAYPVVTSSPTISGHSDMSSAGNVSPTLPNTVRP